MSERTDVLVPLWAARSVALIMLSVDEKAMRTLAAIIADCNDEGRVDASTANIQRLTDASERTAQRVRASLLHSGAIYGVDQHGHRCESQRPFLYSIRGIDASNKHDSSPRKEEVSADDAHTGHEPISEPLYITYLGGAKSGGLSPPSLTGPPLTDSGAPHEYAKYGTVSTPNMAYLSLSPLHPPLSPDENPTPHPYLDVAPAREVPNMEVGGWVGELSKIETGEKRFATETQPARRSPEQAARERMLADAGFLSQAAIESIAALGSDDDKLNPRVSAGMIDEALRDARSSKGVDNPHAVARRRLEYANYRVRMAERAAARAEAFAHSEARKAAGVATGRAIIDQATQRDRDEQAMRRAARAAIDAADSARLRGVLRDLWGRRAMRVVYARAFRETPGVALSLNSDSTVDPIDAISDAHVREVCKHECLFPDVYAQLRRVGGVGVRLEPVENGA